MVDTARARLSILAAIALVATVMLSGCGILDSESTPTHTPAGVDGPDRGSGRKGG